MSRPVADALRQIGGAVATVVTLPSQALALALVLARIFGGAPALARIFGGAPASARGA
ncbi:hypothetical protein ABZ920_12960 [Streptomyces sp. NPDC046831]|uniref:hypothetical protein n=1 Tax=Streptomyces sp. NPDC046831 TaxID=3154805 RepID=UPI0034056883